MDSFFNSIGLEGPIQAVESFLNMGGDVLLLIMAAAFALWVLIFERYWYFWRDHQGRVDAALAVWRARTDHSSWYAHQVRNQLISLVDASVTRNVAMIDTVIGLCPLLGLIGTVTGMIEVFDTLATMGSANARAMASGVSKATVPTMSGMVVAISGLYFAARLKARAKREVHLVADHMELH